MAHTGRRAVVATAAGVPAGHIVDALGIAGISICALARSGPDVIEQIRSIRPDILVSDLILPGADGIDLAQRIPALPLDRYPGILLLDPAGCMPPGESRLYDCGVKVLPKYSGSEEIAAVLQALIPENRALPPDISARLSSLLDDLGIPRHPGRNYLADAVRLVWMDSRYLNSLRRDLYGSVADKHLTDTSKVERAIRYAIDSAWRTGEINRQHHIFGDTIDARRGKPTCGEMIARLADILRWEGRQ